MGKERKVSRSEKKIGTRDRGISRGITGEVRLSECTDPKPWNQSLYHSIFNAEDRVK